MDRGKAWKVWRGLGRALYGLRLDYGVYGVISVEVDRQLVWEMSLLFASM
jgi:hypothetical protein